MSATFIRIFCSQETGRMFICFFSPLYLILQLFIVTEEENEKEQEEDIPIVNGVPIDKNNGEEANEDNDGNNKI